MSIFKYTSFGY